MSRANINFFVAGLVCIALATPFFVMAAPIITNFNDIIAVINNIQAWLFWILMALAVVFILVSAYLFLGSGGDPKKVEAAKNQLIYSIIAVAIALLAKSILAVVSAILHQT